MMKRKAVVLMVILLSYPSYGAIQPLIVDLPGLTGAYAFFSTKTAAFDLGQPISFDIGCVSLRIEGSRTGGVAWIDGTDFTDPFHAGFASEIAAGESPMDVWWSPFPVLSDSFQIECSYEQIGNAKWDFLSDGSAEIPLSFSRTISGSTVIVESPNAEITSAHLVIYPVPEPATLLLLGLGAFLLRQRR